MSSAPDHASAITSLAEAHAYYREKLVGAHNIVCHGQRVTIVFERQATHLFSVAPKESGDASPVVRDGRGARRVFSLERARLMDEVLRSISLYTVSVPGTGPRGREKRLLHGPRLPDDRYLRVVLRPGPGNAFTCVSAYPVTYKVWLAMRQAKRARFPP